MDHSFHAWVAHCFEHPVSDPAWHFDADSPEWSAPSALTLAHLTRFFASPSAVPAPYRDAQINQGLWYIADAFSPFDGALPSVDRVACVSAMVGLYDELFVRRCAPTLGHASVDSGSESPLNSACYMWWDILRVAPLLRDPLRAAIDEAAVTVMEHALTLESIACQESALHGPGHWASVYPERVRAAVDAFLKRGDVPPALRRYALDAREGRVL